MNDNANFRPTGRTTWIDQAVSCDLTGVALRNHQFVRLVASKKRFTECDCCYSEFDSAYLRNCTFDSCKFIGCKFTKSNLRGSTFVGCVFDYVDFSQTQVESEILDSNCPGQENLQQKFARTLRVNFQQIGETIATNKAIKVELEAARIHLHKAWRSRESYYRKKYPGLKRAKMFFEWQEFVLLDFFWGNGESAWKLLRSIVIVTAAIAFGDVYFLGDPWVLKSYGLALSRAPEVLLGVAQPPGFSGVVLSLVTGLRYVMLACLVSILVKRFSRR